MFEFPSFYDYPPYFTVQPVKETQEKQCSLWGTLILSYCKHYKIYQLAVEGTDDLDLFSNKSINRKLNSEGRRLFLSYLVSSGNGEWLDKERTKCLILWKTAAQWADAIYDFVRSYGLENSVLTVDEINRGDETRGTELEGLDREVIVRAVEILEDRGKARLFKGEEGDDEGIKFFP